MLYSVIYTQKSLDSLDGFSDQSELFLAFVSSTKRMLQIVDALLRMCFILNVAGGPSQRPYTNHYWKAELVEVITKITKLQRRAARGQTRAQDKLHAYFTERIEYLLKMNRARRISYAVQNLNDYFLIESN